MESTGNSALNAWFASKPLATRRAIKQIGDGTESKLRLIFDAKSLQYFMFYVTKRDKSLDYPNLILSPHVVEAVSNNYGTPVTYTHPGTLLFYQSGNIVGDFKFGDFVTTDGYTAVYPSEPSARLLGLSAPAKSYLHSRIKSLVLIFRLVPLGGEPEDNPKRLLGMLKGDLKLFGRPLAEAEDDRTSQTAKLEGLSKDDLSALGDLNDEDLLPIIAEIAKRELQFSDQISLWGFTAAHGAMLSSCIELPKPDVPVLVRTRPAPSPSGPIRATKPFSSR
jgi:hypothetical protein